MRYRYKFAESIARNKYTKAYYKFTIESKPDEIRALYISDFRDGYAIFMGDYIKIPKKNVLDGFEYKEVRRLVNPFNDKNLIDARRYIKMIPDTIYCEDVLNEHAVAIFIRSHNLKEIKYG
jgi:hypothetical protein